MGTASLSTSNMHVQPYGWERLRKPCGVKHMLAWSVKRAITDQSCAENPSQAPDLEYSDVGDTCPSAAGVSSSLANMLLCQC
jgi:hypothetical protein